MKELIEKLKDNKVVFGLLSAEETESFEKVGTKNCDYYLEHNDDTPKWNACHFDPIFNDGTTYRIKKDYVHTPPLPTYEDICISLFKDKSFYYIESMGSVDNSIGDIDVKYLIELNNAPTSQQLQKLLYQNKLANIANYLNEGWEADFGDGTCKYFIGFFSNSCEYVITHTFYSISSVVYFKTEDLAKKAIGIMGKEDLNKAFGIC